MQTKTIHRFIIMFDVQVRAAAVFALGRLMANTGNRSDHANMIDHGVATNLASTVGNDGSPLVRKVCRYSVCMKKSCDIHLTLS